MAFEVLMISFGSFFFTPPLYSPHLVPFVYSFELFRLQLIGNPFDLMFFFFSYNFPFNEFQVIEPPVFPRVVAPQQFFFFRPALIER